MDPRRVVTRIWHGAVPAAKADDYLDLMRSVGLPDYRSTPGNLGAWVLRRREADLAHFLMVTQWESIEAVKAFAGDDVERAKYYDFDADFLVELEPIVHHWETFSD
jgi:heme-degrading monooxygenase HmoA